VQCVCRYLLIVNNPDLITPDNHVALQLLLNAKCALINANDKNKFHNNNNAGKQSGVLVCVFQCGCLRLPKLFTAKRTNTVKTI